MASIADERVMLPAGEPPMARSGRFAAGAAIVCFALAVLVKPCVTVLSPRLAVLAAYVGANNHISCEWSKGGRDYLVGSDVPDPWGSVWRADYETLAQFKARTGATTPVSYRTGRDFFSYSVGPNRQDERGQGDDIVFPWELNGPRTIHPLAICVAWSGSFFVGLGILIAWTFGGPFTRKARSRSIPLEAMRAAVVASLPMLFGLVVIGWLPSQMWSRDWLWPLLTDHGRFFAPGLGGLVASVAFVVALYAVAVRLRCPVAERPASG